MYLIKYLSIFIYLYLNYVELLILLQERRPISEMPGFLSGGLTVLIAGEPSMLSAAIGKMFHSCMFADIIWMNVPETV